MWDIYPFTIVRIVPYIYGTLSNNVYPDEIPSMYALFAEVKAIFNNKFQNSTP